MTKSDGCLVGLIAWQAWGQQSTVKEASSGYIGVSWEVCTVQCQYSGVAQDKTGGERRVSLLCSVCLGKLAWSSSVWEIQLQLSVRSGGDRKAQHRQTDLGQTVWPLWEKIKQNNTTQTTHLPWENSSSNNSFNIRGKQLNIFKTLSFLELYSFIWFLLMFSTT